MCWLDIMCHYRAHLHPGCPLGGGGEGAGAVGVAISGGSARRREAMKGARREGEAAEMLFGHHVLHLLLVCVVRSKQKELALTYSVT